MYRQNNQKDPPAINEAGGARCAGALSWRRQPPGQDLQRQCTAKIFSLLFEVVSAQVPTFLCSLNSSCLPGALLQPRWPALSAPNSNHALSPLGSLSSLFPGACKGPPPIPAACKKPPHPSGHSSNVTSFTKLSLILQQPPERSGGPSLMALVQQIDSACLQVTCRSQCCLLGGL